MRESLRCKHEDFVSDKLHMNEKMHDIASQEIQKRIASLMTHEQDTQIDPDITRDELPPTAPAFNMNRSQIFRDLFPPEFRAVSFLADSPSLTNQWQPAELKTGGKAVSNRLDRIRSFRVPLCHKEAEAKPLRFEIREVSSGNASVRKKEVVHRVQVGPDWGEDSTLSVKVEGRGQSTPQIMEFRRNTTFGKYVKFHNFFTSWYEPALEARPLPVSAGIDGGLTLVVCNLGPKKDVRLRWVVAVMDTNPT